MKRLIFLLLLIFIGFYGIWPAISAYGIYNGLKAEDEAVLEAKVDWPSVRASFKEAVEPLVAEQLQKQSGKMSGQIEGLAGVLGASFAPKIVDILVDTYMTPKGLVELSKSGGKINVDSAMAELGRSLPIGGGGNEGGTGMTGRLSDVLKDVAGGLGGIPGADKLKDLISGNKSGGGSSGSGNGSSGQIPPIGMGNIKSFYLTSPTQLELSLSQDPEATKPDVTAAMGFKDWDWKLVKIVPHL